MKQITEGTIKKLAKYPLGRGNNLGVWASYEKEGHTIEWLELKKYISSKSSVGTRLFYYEYDEDKGNNIKIEFYIMGYYNWDTVFEGWVDDDEQLLQLYKMLGI